MKLQKVVEPQPSETHPSAILVTLACGHSHIIIESSVDVYQRLIDAGERRECNDCEGSHEHN